MFFLEVDFFLNFEFTVICAQVVFKRLSLLPTVYIGSLEIEAILHLLQIYTPPHSPNIRKNDVQEKVVVHTLILLKQEAAKIMGRKGKLTPSSYFHRGCDAKQ